jgi:hypothetical protein
MVHLSIIRTFLEPKGSMTVFQWVLNDGRCRAYKATRQNGNVVYEEDDLFHVSFIAEVFQQVWNSA